MKSSVAARAAATRRGVSTAVSAEDGAAPLIPDALRNFDAMPGAAYVRLPVVCALFQVSPSTAWRWCKSGHIPAPRRLSQGVTAWNVDELRKALRGEPWQ